MLLMVYGEFSIDQVWSTVLLLKDSSDDDLAEFTQLFTFVTDWY